MKTEHARLWTPDYCRILAANLLLLVAGNAMGSTFSLYIFSRGGTEMDVGICSYIQASACLLIRPLAGWFLDHRSRRAMVIWGLFSLAFIQLGFIFAASILLIYFVRFVHAAVNAAASTALMTNAYDTLSAETFTEGVGYFGFSNSVANAIAPGVGLWLWDRFGAAGVFGVIGAAIFAGFLLCRGFHFHDLSAELRTPFRQEKIRDLIYEKDALPASVLEGFIALGSGAINPYLSVFLIQRAVLQTPGLFYTAQAAGTFSARLFVGRISRRWGEAPIVYLSAIMFSLGILALTFSNIPLLVLAGAFLMGIGYGLSVTGFQIMSVRVVAPERRGAASSTYSCGWDVFAALGGLLSGTLITVFSSYQTAFCLLILIYPVFVLVYVCKISKHPSAFRNYQRAAQRPPFAT